MPTSEQLRKSHPVRTSHLSPMLRDQVTQLKEVPLFCREMNKGPTRDKILLFNPKRTNAPSLLRLSSRSGIRMTMTAKGRCKKAVQTQAADLRQLIRKSSSKTRMERQQRNPLKTRKTTKEATIFTSTNVIKTLRNSNAS